MSDIICISHLRWEEIAQTPDYLPSRLSRQRRLLYVEEPLIMNGDSGEFEPYVEFLPLDIASGAKITVARLMMPMGYRECYAHNDMLSQPIYATKIMEYMTAESFKSPILWMYTPLALPYSVQIPHKLLVYDKVESMSDCSVNEDWGLYDQSLLQQANVVIQRHQNSSLSHFPA
jgi:hypothetical protein